MLEIFTQIDHVVAAYNGLILLVPGLVGVLWGIYLWLGGALTIRVSVGTVWFFIVAGITAFFLKPLPAIGVGMMSCMVAMLFKRLSTCVMVSILMTFLAFLIVCQYAGLIEIPEKMPAVQEASMPEQTLDANQTFEHFKGQIVVVCKGCQTAWQALSINYQIVVGVTAFFVLLIGGVVQKLADAVCCAASGAVCLWAGMALLLLLKGAKPLAGLYVNSGTYVAMFTAMILVGSIEQLMFCTRSKSKSKEEGKKKEAGKKGK